MTKNEKKEIVIKRIDNLVELAFKYKNLAYLDSACYYLVDMLELGVISEYVAHTQTHRCVVYADEIIDRNGGRKVGQIQKED